MNKICDYLGHVPVVMFPETKFMMNDTCDTSYFYTEGGRFRHYKTGDKLPLKTLTYKYPDTFLVVTSAMDEMCFVVEDGVYMGIDNLKGSGELTCPVYDFVGNLLKVHTFLDIRTMKVLLNEYVEADDKDGFYKELSSWIMPTEIEADPQLNVFSRYVSIFPQMRLESDEDYHKYKLYFKSFLKFLNCTPQELANKYKNWLEEELMPFKDIDTIIRLTLEEPED